MIIVLDRCQMAIEQPPTGEKVLVFVDAGGQIAVKVPMSGDAAKKLGTALATGIVVASGPLPGEGSLLTH